MPLSDPYGLIASGLPPELAAQLSGVNHQQAIAEALLAQSMRPVENIGGVGAKLHPLQGLAQMLQSYRAQTGMADADRVRADIASQKERGVADALMKYEQARSGSPAIPAPADELGGGPGAPAIKGDPRAAIAAAMGNVYLRGNPVVAADLKSYEESQKPYNLRAAEKRFVGNQEIAANAPKPQEHIINGKLYVTGPDGNLVERGGPGEKPDPNKPFNPATGEPNTAYQEYEKSKALAGATRVQTNVNAFTPASEEAQRDFMKSTRATYDQLKHAPVLLDSIEKAKELVPKAQPFVGSGAEGKLAFVKFLNNNFGADIKPEEVGNAEALRTRIFFNIMDNLKKMDAQPSEMQQKIMQEALGNLGTDPGALPRVLDAFGDVIRGKVTLHNQEVQGAIQKGVKFPFEPLVKIPELQRRASDKTRLKFDAQGNQIP